MNKFIIAFALFLQMNLVWSSQDNFYARKEVQSKYPGAFASHRSAVPFHIGLKNRMQPERDLLVEKIKERPLLLSSIIHFDELPLEKQVDVLEVIFLIECEVMNITPPELIINEDSIPGHAFFEYNFQAGGAGKVYLNKKKLMTEKNKFEFIVLLLHETRHSAQFQMAQKLDEDPLTTGFREAFVAQQELKAQGHKFSFCDFMLLHNEFEAFQFANYVYGALIHWKSPINDMGTLAGQYDQSGNVRINLLSILTQTEQDPLELFNQLEFAQYKVLYE